MIFRFLSKLFEHQRVNEYQPAREHQSKFSPVGTTKKFDRIYMMGMISDAALVMLIPFILTKNRKKNDNSVLLIRQQSTLKDSEFRL